MLLPEENDSMLVPLALPNKTEEQKKMEVQFRFQNYVQTEKNSDLDMNYTATR